MDIKNHKILLRFDKDAATDRLMLEGILHYAREKCIPQWDIQLELSDISRHYDSKLEGGGFSGIIADSFNATDRGEFFKTGLPTVLYESAYDKMDSSSRPKNNVTFFNDHTAEGRTAAEYFIERGFKSFAYVGTPIPIAWSVSRRNGFVSRLKKSGMHAIIYPDPVGKAAGDFTTEAPILTKWLKSLPARTALFATHDRRAQQIVSLARQAKINIPEEIAVLGVDDDELICETATPPISSIRVFARETGWRMARAMHALLEGRAHATIVRTCHTNITSRRSTEIFALGDKIVAKALTYAATHLSEDLRVRTLADISNCSVRTLQMKMLLTLGRTVKEEIASLRLTKAIELLSESSLPVAEIAKVCGYSSSSHLGTKTKEATGKTPRKIRREAIA